jgi:hypothetical protein
MSKFIGRVADVGIAKESSRGTSPGSAAFWLPKTSLTLDDGIEQAMEETSVGAIEDATDAVRVGRFAEGEIEGNIQANSFGLLLLAALGSSTPSGPAQTSVYTHTFTVSQSAQHPSLSLYLEDPNQDYTYAMAMLQSLNIDISLNQFARYTAAFRSRVGATATLTPSYTAQATFLPQHGTVKIATNVAGLGAASALDVRSVQLTINKNVEDDRKIGSLDQADILNKQLSVEGTVELVFNDNTFKTQMLADTEQAMRIELTNTDVTIGTSLNPKLTIDLSKIKVTSFEKNYGNNDIVTATVAFKAFYKLSESDMIEAVLVNTTASY